MLFDELHSHDNGLTLLYPPKYTGEISGLSNLSHLKPDSVVFIKNSKYFEIFKKSYDYEHLSSVGVILETKYAEKFLANDPDEWKVLIEKVAFVAGAADVNLSMSHLSKPFYHLQSENWNDEVDGRQMGTAEIHPTAYLAQNVFLGKGVKIGANTRIHSGAVLLSGVVIGDNSEIYPNVTIYHDVKIGKNVRIHSGSVIGADGFGYNHDSGIHHKVWHMGSVVIEDEVEVGANSCVDQGTFSATKIGHGSKLDNHVQIGHNCHLGRGVVICGHVAIGGSSRIGDYSVFGGKSGMGDNMQLGKGCQVAGGALVNTDWGDGAIVGGHPARPLKEWMRGLAYVRKESLRK